MFKNTYHMEAPYPGMTDDIRAGKYFTEEYKRKNR